jgi:hypothetical protein
MVFSVIVLSVIMLSVIMVSWRQYFIVIAPYPTDCQIIVRFFMNSILGSDIAKLFSQVVNDFA